MVVATTLLLDVEHVDRPAGQARIGAAVIAAVTVEVVIHLAGKVLLRHDVAEVEPGLVHAALGGDGVVVGVDRLGLGPAALQDFLDGERAGEQVVELVVAVGVTGGGGHRVARGIEQVDRPALEARVARIEVAIAVEVVVNLAADVHELEVAEVDPARGWCC